LYQIALEKEKISNIQKPRHLKPFSESVNDYQKLKAQYINTYDL